MQKAIEREAEISMIDKARVWVGDTKLPDYYAGPSWEVGESIPSDLGPRMVALFKEEKLPPERVAQQILLAAFDYWNEMPSLVHIDVPEKDHITVCGDTHGQFFDVVHIFEENGIPSKKNPYLFNGDYVDRGSFSVEVFLTLASFMIAEPKSVYLSRGNHESRGLNQMYGFSGEVTTKYSSKMYDVFSEVFRVLPLCHVLNKKVIVIHGGLPRQGDVTLSEITAIDRKREIPEDGVMTDLLWADPGETPGISMSKRGTSRAFGPDITKLFLETNNLKLLVR
jgi:serine/threonine-protein phosphatase 5